MAGTIHPDGADAATYRGLSAIYEFVNADGQQRPFNCGQAAACTLFAFCEGSTPADADAAGALMSAVEEAHPPDNLFGWFGTSRRRVERICLSRGIELGEIEGEVELRAALGASGRPMALMVELPGRKVLGFRNARPGTGWSRVADDLTNLLEQLSRSPACRGTSSARRGTGFRAPARIDARYQIGSTTKTR